MSAKRSSSKSGAAGRAGAWVSGIVVFGFALALTAVACYDPMIVDGHLPCMMNMDCPSGFYCSTSCGACYHQTPAGQELAQTCTVVDIHGSVDGGNGGGSGEGTGGVHPGGTGGGGGLTGTGGGGIAGGSAGAGGPGGMVGSGGHGGTIVGGSGGTPGGAGGMSGAAGGMGTAGHIGTGGTSGVGGGTGSGGAMMGAGGTMGVGGKTGTGGAMMGVGGAMMGVGGAMMGTGGATGSPLGSACLLGTQCASGLCVDKVCCHDACSGQCQACDIAPNQGTCLPVPSGPPHGVRAACGGTGVCGGQCALTTATAAACVFAATSVSCAQQTCTGSTLTPARSCDGLGSCSSAAPAACPASLSCNTTQTACLASCASSADCTPAAPNCNPGTHQCTTSRAIGASCTVAADCQNGQCVDNFCCDQLCNGSCQACDNMGQEGHCSLVASGQPHGLRTPCGAAGSTCGSRCDGSDAQCHFPSGNSCTCPDGLGLLGSCNGAGECQTTLNLCLL